MKPSAASFGTENVIKSFDSLFSSSYIFQCTKIIYSLSLNDSTQ